MPLQTQRRGDMFIPAAADMLRFEARFESPLRLRFSIHLLL
jgi:hypothetical protein